MIYYRLHATVVPSLFTKTCPSYLLFLKLANFFPLNNTFVAKLLWPKSSPRCKESKSVCMLCGYLFILC